MEERLQKFLANQGVCSRRKAEQYILEGKVKVNGQIVTELGTKINTDVDKIEFNNKLISNETEKKYILLSIFIFLIKFPPTAIISFLSFSQT